MQKLIQRLFSRNAVEIKPKMMTMGEFIAAAVDMADGYGFVKAIQCQCEAWRYKSTGKISPPQYAISVEIVGFHQTKRESSPTAALAQLRILLESHKQIQSSQPADMALNAE